VAGKKAFQGKSQASLIAAILKDEPARVSSLQPMTPATLDRTINTCLAKDRDSRWQTAHDLRLQLQWIAQGDSQQSVPLSAVVRRGSRDRLAWILAGIATLSTLALALPAARRFFRPIDEQQIRFEIPTPTAENQLPFAISPDGRKLAYLANNPDGKPV